MSEPKDTWPAILREVAEVVGEEDALRLARACGGVEMVVPRDHAANHPWRSALGASSFAKLVHVFGGRSVSLPRGTFVASLQRRADVLALHATGKTARDIALRLELTERHVRRIIAAAKQADGKAADDGS